MLRTASRGSWWGKARMRVGSGTATGCSEWSVRRSIMLTPAGRSTPS